MKPECSVSMPLCPNPQDWKMYDGMATEYEVLEFLRALVIVIKPKVIVETGCYLGHGTERLVQGVIANGFGHVYTCDLDHTMAVRTNERLEGLSEYVDVSQRTGLDLISSIPVIDFAFIDGGPHERAKEIREVSGRLPPHGIMAVHDTSQTHPDIRKEVHDTVEELGLRYVQFCTPRGLTLVSR